MFVSQFNRDSLFIMFRSNRMNCILNIVVLFFGALAKSKFKIGQWFSSFVPISNVLVNNKTINGVNNVT